MENYKGPQPRYVTHIGSCSIVIPATGVAATKFIDFTRRTINRNNIAYNIPYSIGIIVKMGNITYQQLSFL